MARLVTRNFTQALGYAKRPLLVVHDFADARFGWRRLLLTHAFADARIRTQRTSLLHSSVGGGNNIHFFRYRYPSLAISNIFWVLSPKIVVVLAENQYLGRFEGIHDVTMTVSYLGLNTIIVTP